METCFKTLKNGHILLVRSNPRIQIWDLRASKPTDPKFEGLFGLFFLCFAVKFQKHFVDYESSPDFPSTQR